MILLFVSRRGCSERVYIFFALCVCAIPFPAAYGAEEIATLDAVPTLVFRLGSHLVRFGATMGGEGGASLARRGRPGWARMSLVVRAKGVAVCYTLFGVPFRR